MTATSPDDHTPTSATERWAWCPDEQRMKAVLTHIHVIPLEGQQRSDDPGMCGSAPMHLAQSDCWCSPRPDPNDPALIIHNAVTAGHAGWALVGENRLHRLDPSCPDTIERAATLIYEHAIVPCAGSPPCPPADATWTPGGNSLMQGVARRAARCLVESLPHQEDQK